MAHLIVDFYADALGVETRMHVLLPQRLTGRAKTLYLLHGMSDDEGTWMRRTAIDRYAEEKDLAVVMPDGGLGWYTDMRRGLPWFTFVSKELPALCRRFFPILSGRREDTYIGGLSMGGYGALKCGLRAPETFSKVISLSGALDAADTASTTPSRRRGATGRTSSARRRTCPARKTTSLPPPRRWPIPPCGPKSTCGAARKTFSTPRTRACAIICARWATT